MQDVDSIVARAASAQRAYESWSEERVDALLTDITRTIVDHAEDLAIATVAETGLGNGADKTHKNRFVSKRVLDDLIGKPGAGVLRIDPLEQVAECAAAAIRGEHGVQVMQYGKSHGFNPLREWLAEQGRKARDGPMFELQVQTTDDGIMLRLPNLREWLRCVPSGVRG